MTALWKRNYYEHLIPAGGILRDQTDHEWIARYITSNLLNWEEDEGNPKLPDDPWVMHIYSCLVLDQPFRQVYNLRPQILTEIDHYAIIPIE